MGNEPQQQQPIDPPKEAIIASQRSLESILQEKAPDVLKKLQKEEKNRLARVSISETIVKIGILPDPADLAQYNQIIPNGADRILKMVESQHEHRIEIEKHVIKSQQSQTTRGQYFAFLLALVCIAVSCYLGVAGHEFLGGAIGGTTLLSLVSVFLYSRHKQATSLQQKLGPAPGTSQKRK